MSSDRSDTTSNRSRLRTLRLLPNQILPKEVRNELRMTVALRGYSAMREGDGMSAKKQEKFLYDFFHGVTNKSPSQIQMMAEGLSPYDDLYESKTISIVTSKSNGKKTTRKKCRRFLKEKLSREISRQFYIGDHITYSDLEKKLFWSSISYFSTIV